MAACTSRAAASMLRLRSNCSVIDVPPSELLELISVTPAMRPNWRSSGVATAEAIVSGLAPGSPAFTEMVGNSTSGSGATGSLEYANAPASNTAMLSSDVPTGRRINGVEILIRIQQSAIGLCVLPMAYCVRSVCSRRYLHRIAHAVAVELVRQSVEV